VHQRYRRQTDRRNCDSKDPNITKSRSGKKSFEKFLHSPANGQTKKHTDTGDYITSLAQVTIQYITIFILIVIYSGLYGPSKCPTRIAGSTVNDSTSALLVKYRGVSGYYVCSDQWTSAFSDAVCQQLGYASVCCHIYMHRVSKT